MTIAVDLGRKATKQQNNFPLRCLSKWSGSKLYISCSHRKLWVNKKCSGIKGRLNVTPDYVCPRCLDQARPIDGRPTTQVEVDGTLLDVEASFCYLRDMLSTGGGCALAIATRCSTAWGKFRKLLPILTSKHVSPLTHGLVFSVSIRSALLHGSETWAQTAPDLQRLCRNDRAMIRWICGVKPHDEVPMETLYTKLRIQEVAVALRTKRLRWYVMSRVHLPGQIQLPVSPSLAREDMGDQGSLGLSV